MSVFEPPAEAEFFARVWLDEESINHIETWVQELEPIDPKLRPLSEWVLGHLQDLDYEYYLDLIKQDPLEERCYQIVFTGTLKGYWASYGFDATEWEEDITLLNVHWIKVPKEVLPSV